MKVLAVSVQQSQGISDKSGALKPYHMASLSYLVPLESRNKVDTVKGTSYRMDGYGLQLVEMSLDPDCLSEFSKVTFPAMLDIQTEAQPMFGKVQTVVTGLSAVPVRQAA